MSETVQREVQIIYSANCEYYAIPGSREAGIWLSLRKYELPVRQTWRAPGLAGAAVMRGRDYYRFFSVAPMNQGRSGTIAADDELVRDYADAAWWTPGLEEA